MAKKTVAELYDSQFRESPFVQQIPNTKAPSLVEVFGLPTEEDSVRRLIADRPSTVGEYFQGDSQYDYGLTPDDLENIDFIRGERQSVGAKWRNAGFKTLGTFSLAVTDNFLGTAAGIINLASDPTWKGFYRNPVSEYIHEIRQKMETFAPNYRTRAEAEMPFWEAMIPGSGGFANFWGDEFMKNLGFNSAAFVGMGVYGGMMRSVLGQSKNMSNVVKGAGLIGKTTTAGKVIKTETEAFRALRQGLLRADDIPKNLAADIKSIRIKDAVSNLTGSTLGAAAEARIETLDNMDQFEQEQVDVLNQRWQENYENIKQALEAELKSTNPELFNQVTLGQEGIDTGWAIVPGEKANEIIEQKMRDLYAQQYEEILKATTLVGNTSFIANTAIVSASTYLQFARNLSTGFTSAKKTAYSTVISGTGKDATARLAVDASKFSKFANYTAGITKALGNSFWEGIEEGLQKTSGAGAGDYYKKRLDPEASEDAADILNSIMYGLSEAFTTEEGLREVFIGALSGGLGTPTFGIGKASYKLAGVIPMGGGIVGDIKQIGTDLKQARSIAEQVEKLVQSDRYQTGYKNLVSMMSDSNMMLKSMVEDNEHEYRNAEFNLFMQDVMLMNDAGLFQELVDKFEAIKNTPVEQLRALTAFVAEDGTIDIKKGIHSTKTDQEVKEFYQKKMTALQNKAKVIRDFYELVDVKLGPSVPTPVKETLVYYLSNVYDSELRISQLLEEIGTSALNQDQILDLTGLEGNLLSETAKEMYSEAVFKEEGNVEEFIKNLQNTVKGNEVLEKKVKDLEKLLKRRKAFVNSYINAIKLGTGKIQQAIADLEELEKKEAVVAKAKEFYDGLKDGTELFDKKSGESIGKVFKVGDELRLYTTIDENGNPTGEYRVVDTKSTQFADSVTKTAPSKGFVTDADVKNILSRFEKIKDPDEFVEEVEKLKAENKLTKELRDKLGKLYKKISGSKEIGYIDKVYKNNKTGRNFVVRKGSDGLYYLLPEEVYLKDKTIKNKPNLGRKKGLSKKELDANFTFRGSLLNHRQRLSYISALTNLIVRKESLFAEKQEKYNKLRDNLNRITAEIDRLTQELWTDDKRKTEKTIKKLTEVVNDLRIEQETVEEEVRDSQKVLDSLKNQIDLLYNEYDKIDQNEERYKLKERIDRVKEDIEVVESLMSKWKALVQKIKDILNAFNKALRSFRFHRPDKLVAARMQKEAALQELYEEEYLARNPELSPEGNLTDIFNKLQQLEKASEELWQELFILEEFAEEYKKEYTVFGKAMMASMFDPAVKKADKINKAKAKTKTEHDGTLTGDYKQAKNFFKSAKRRLRNLFRGLGGSEAPFDQMNDNPSQRRYYRFTRSNRLVPGKYFTKAVRAKDFLSEEEYNKILQDIEKSGEKYTGYDEEILITVFVDSKGNYINEKGSAIPSEDLPANINDEGKLTGINTELVYTVLRTSNTSTKAYGMMTFEGTDQEIKRLRDEWYKFRKDIVTQLNAGKDVYLPVVGKSKGSPVMRNHHFTTEKEEDSFRPLAEVIGKTTDLKVTVATESEITIDDMTTKVPLGFTYVIDEDTGNVYPVQRRTLTNEEIDLISRFWEVMASRVTVLPSGFVDFTGMSKMYQKDSQGKLREVQLNGKEANIFTMLQTMVFWSSDNWKDSAEVEKVMKNGKLSIEEKINRLQVMSNDPKYSRNTNPNTRFHFDKTAIGEAALRSPVVMGTKSVNLLNEDLSGINPEFVTTLREFLKELHIQVNNSILKENGGILSIESIDENGVITLKKDHEKYQGKGGYNSYLIETGTFSTPIIQRGIEQSVDNSDGTTIREEVPQFLNQYAIVDQIIQNDTKYVPPKPDEKPPAGKKEGPKPKLSEKPSAESSSIPLDIGDSENIVVAELSTFFVKGVKEVNSDKAKRLSISSVELSKLSYPEMFALFKKEGISEGMIAYYLIVANLIQEQGQQKVEELGTADAIFNASKTSLAKKLLALKKQTPASQTKDSGLPTASEMDSHFADYTGEDVPPPSVEDELKPTDPKEFLRQTNREEGIKEFEDLSEAEKEVQRLFGGAVRFSKTGEIIGLDNTKITHGRFKDAIITLYELAEYGTVYHEAFHALTQMYLTPAQRRALYNEYRRKNDKPELTDKEVEELLAEDYRRYRLEEPISYLNTKTPSGVIGKLFRWLKNAINKLFGIYSIKEQFEMLTSGYYTRARVRNAKTSELLRTSRNKLTSTEIRKLLDAFNLTFFFELHGIPDGINMLIDKQTGQKVINDIYKKIFSKDIFGRFKDTLVPAHVRYLKQLGIETTEELQELWIQEINELDRYKDAANSWVKQSLRISPKKSASKYVRIALAGLPKLERDRNGRVSLVKKEGGYPTLADSGNTFNLLINKLSGITSIEDMKMRLQELFQTHPEIEYLYNKVFKFDKNPSELTANEISGIFQFAQAFAKTRNIFLTEIVNSGGSYSIINMNQQFAQIRIQARWKSNYFNRFKDPNYKRFYKVVDGKTIYNIEEFKKLDLDKSTLSSLDFYLDVLNKIGIEFDNIQEIANNPEFIKTITENGRWILNMIKRGKAVNIFRKDIDIDVGKRVASLVDVEIQTSKEALETSLINSEGNLIYGSTLNSYLTLVLNEIIDAKNEDDLYTKLPHLLFVKNSLLLSDFNKLQKIAVEILDGARESEYNEAVSTSKQRPADRLRSRINAVLEGKYNLLRPSDNSIERYITMGEFFSIPDIIAEKHLDTFIDYLYAELSLRNQLISEDYSYKHVEKNITRGVILDMIGSTDPVLKNAIVKDLRGGTDPADIVSKYNSIIKTALRNYLSRQTETNINLLFENNLIQRDTGTNIKNLSLTDRLVPANTDMTNIETVMELYTINSIVGNIEQSKLLINDPVFFNNIDDVFKRLSGMVGTKDVSFTDPYSNTTVDILDKNSRLKQQYDGSGNPIIKTSVVQDVMITTKNKSVLEKAFTFLKDKYNIAKEPDGFGLIHLDEYRRMLMRAGKWTFGRNSLEEAYQREMNMSNYTDPVTGEVLFSLKNENKNLPTFNVLKPQHFGPLANDTFVPALYKLALMPILPSVMDNRNMQIINEQMERQNIGILVFDSAVKVGIYRPKGYSTSLYNEDGELNFNANNPMPVQDTYYKYWGLQVETGTHIKSKVVTGTQMVKQFLNYIAESGNILTHQEKIRSYLHANNKRLQLGQRILAQKLGLKKDKSGNWYVDNSEEFLRILIDASIKRDMSLNFIDGLEFVSENGVDVLPNREKVENILFALADSSIMRQKRSGRSSVQVPVTLFEELGIKREKSKSGKEYLSSDVLNYYEPELNSKGEIVSVKSMEVLISEVWEGVVEPGQILDDKLLKLIGFRIPTQGPNSIEHIKIKGFLPKSFGDTIVVPSDIVIKTGSDFDIDKLNIYIPNFYYNDKNDPVYIDEDSSYQTYLDHQAIRINKKFDEILLRKSHKISRAARELIKSLISEYRKQDSYSLSNVQQLAEKIVDKINELRENPSEGAQQFAAELEDLVGLIVAESDSLSTFEDSILSPEEFEILKAENTMTQVMADVLSSPEMAQFHLNPIASTYLKDQAIYIEYLKSDSKLSFNEFKEAYLEMEGEKSFTNLVETASLLDIEQRFLTAQDAIGIVAVNATFHVQAQLTDLQIDSSKVTLNLEHNKSEDGNISLSKRQDVLGETYIAEMIAQWVNASVDASTDPFMHDLNINTDTLNVVLFLTIAGVPTSHVSLFMSLPSIKEFVRELNRQKSLTQKANENIVKLDKIVQAVFNNLDLGSPDMVGSQTLTKELLEEAIKNPSSRQSRIIQAQALSDFIHYREVGNEMYKATQAINYDTASFGKNLAELVFKLIHTQSMLLNQDSIFINLDKMLGVEVDFEDGVPTINRDDVVDSFIKDYYNSARNLIGLVKPFFKVLKFPAAKDALIKLNKIYKDNEIFLSGQDMMKISSMFISDMITYVITNYAAYNGKLLKDHAGRLFKGDRTIADRLNIMKKDPRYSDMILLNSLEVSLSQDGTTFNIILAKKPGSSQEADTLSDEWLSLINGEPDAHQFGMDLIITSLLQSGLQYSATSLIEIIPTGPYNDLVTEAFDSFELSDDSLNKFMAEFFLSNYNNDNIVPMQYGRKKINEGFPFYKKADYLDKRFENRNERQKALQKRIPVYKSLPKIFDNSTHEQLKIENPPIKDYRNSVLLHSLGSMNITFMDGTMYSLPQFSGYGDVLREHSDNTEENNSKTPFCLT